MSSEAPLPIVGLGASAGGLEALEAFFRAAPDDAGVAYVIVAHSAPGRASMMVEILSRSTRMKMGEAHDGERLEADHVYVIAPDTALTVADGELRVQALPPPRRERHPIDTLFGSIAEARGERGVGVVLAGAGADGALGVKAIKERGGLTLAQGADGSAARRHAMPSAAIATGLVDLVIPVEEMPERILAYVRALDAPDEPRAPAPASTEAERQEKAEQAIQAALRRQVGHDFSGYKEGAFMRRVRRRMRVLQLETVEAYAEHLRLHADEASLLFRDLLIGVTKFFRDADAFAALERLAIPAIFEGKGAGDVVRIWAPACATGEEVYSIAMLACEQMSRMQAPPRVQVFATDIDEQALPIARAGRYPTALLESITAERLARFFVADSGGYVVARELRELCIFSSHSVVRDPPFSRMDLVSCRNLLIYLKGEQQDRLLRVLHYALRPGGYLLLGLSENAMQHSDLFAPADRKNRLFQRREAPAGHINFPIAPVGLAAAQAAHFAGSGRIEGGGRGVATLRRAVELRVLERFAPAHVVINGEGDVLHFSSRTGTHLESPAGRPTPNLMEMARRGLRLDLRTALQEARETRRTVLRERVPVEIDDRVQLTTLTVEPFADDSDQRLYLVLFSDAGPPPAPEMAASRGRSQEDGDAATLQLERELRDSRDRLQATIDEEYETSVEELKFANEVLVSVNEEVQSANEELETSREEIQSINEELHTVNSELNRKVEELDRANADMRNLFESTRIAVIFLNRDLVIRSYTPAVLDLFNLIPSDKGRPLTDIAHRLEGGDPIADARQTLGSGEPVERRVRRRGTDTSYLMRALPYRAADGEIDGALLTFVDVSGLVRAEERQRVMVAELNHRVRNMLAVVMGVAMQTMQGDRSAAEAGEVFLGRLSALAQAHTLVSRQQWAAAPLRELLDLELAPFQLEGKERIRLDGPEVPLGPKAAMALGMTTHELATNAAKYGALAKPAGYVELDWRIEHDRLVLEWRERDGPTVRPPQTVGFGSKLVKRQLEYELGGEVAIEYPEDGVRVRMSLPLARLMGSDAPPGEG